VSRWIATIVLFAGLCFGASPALGQETASDRMYAAALKRASAAYNKGEYDGAITGFIEAIQANPSQPNAYRNLARAFFWKGNYAAAVEYYDHYARLVPASSDHDKIKAERRLAAERAGETLYTPPSSQRQAMNALTQELESGRAYTRGGGGAWGLYETLLRTRFAEPILVGVRARLARRLLDEFDATIVPRATQLTPRLDLDAWQLQAERLAVAQSITDDLALIDVMQKRSTVVEAAIAMLTTDWDDAAKLSHLARESNPDLGFIVWYEASSLIGAQQYEEALALLTEAESSERDASRLAYLRVLRAVALQRLSRNDDAAAIYLEILRD
jgi:tetratricopeptide (TPR) repeat protein